MATDSMSLIDLAHCSSYVAPHLHWMVLSYLCGSDHYPVLIHIFTPHPALKYWKNWILSETNWTLFKQSITLPTEILHNVNNIVDCFTTTVLLVAESAIPISTVKASHPPVPWWNMDCAAAVLNWKWALNQLCFHPIMKNLITYKKCWYRVRQVKQDSKKSSSVPDIPLLVWPSMDLSKQHQLLSLMNLLFIMYQCPALNTLLRPFCPSEYKRKTRSLISEH